MLQKCDKNATQIPTYLVKLSVASEPDNRVQRCQEFHYKKTPRTCTFECTSIHYVFPPCSLHTLPFKERFTYDFLPRRNIYISIYVHHIYKFTQSCSLLIAKINSEFLRKIVSTKFSLTRSSFIDRDESNIIEFRWCSLIALRKD